MKIASAIVAVYLAISFTCYGWVNATNDRKCHTKWRNICDIDLVRSDWGWAVFSGFLPIGWPTAILTTGVGGDGWKLSMNKPDH